MRCGAVVRDGAQQARLRVCSSDVRARRRGPAHRQGGEVRPREACALSVDGDGDALLEVVGLVEAVN